MGMDRSDSQQDETNTARFVRYVVPLRRTSGIEIPISVWAPAGEPEDARVCAALVSRLDQDPNHA
jgi:hypothetical protein